MSRSTRILLCRLGCVAFCLLPTAIVSGWACWRSTAHFSLAQKSDWERELSLQLGVAVEIEHVHYPAPWVARLEGVRLLASSSRCLAEAEAVEIVAESRGWHVELWQPRVQASELPLIARELTDHVMGRSQPLQNECLVVARELTIVRSGESQSLLDVSAHLTASKEPSELTFQCRLPDAPSAANHVSLHVRQDRGELDTAGQEVPCQLLADFWPGISRLGSNCRFAGTAALDHGSGSWSAEIAGRIAPLDLDALVSEQFPHRLSGQATLDVERLIVQQGRLVELHGMLRASHGTLSRSLLAAAQEHLRVSIDSRLAGDDAGATIPYQRLALGFQLTDRSLSLAGLADPTTSGVLAANASGIIAEAPPGHSVAAINLIRMLVPHGEFQVPAARQTAQLVALLPLPDAATHGALTHTPTRLSAAPAVSPQPVRQPAMR